MCVCVCEREREREKGKKLEELMRVHKQIQKETARKRRIGKQ